MATTPGTETVICRYWVRPEKEADFLKLLESHYPTLRSLELVTDDRPQYFRGVDRAGDTFIIEIFTWVACAAQKAHELPEVMAIWEPMGNCLLQSDGRPRWEFPHVQPFAVENTHA